MTVFNSDSQRPTGRLELRAARDGDLESVHRLVRACELPTDGIDDQFKANYAVACWQHELVGVAGVEIHDNDGLLRSVAVAASQRGKGIAAALVNDRIAWSRQRHLRALYLLTTTAGGYFAKHGFVTVARATVPLAIRESREFAETCPDSAVVMVRPL